MTPASLLKVLGADLAILVVPADPFTASLASIASTIAQIRAASAKGCPLAVIITTDKREVDQATLLARENLDLADPKVTSLTRALTERSSGTLPDGWQHLIVAALELSINTSILKTPDSPSSNLDKVLSWLDQCDSGTFKCLGQCVTTLCESAVLLAM